MGPRAGPQPCRQPRRFWRSGSGRFVGRRRVGLGFHSVGERIDERIEWPHPTMHAAAVPPMFAIPTISDMDAIDPEIVRPIDPLRRAVDLGAGPSGPANPIRLGQDRRVQSACQHKVGGSDPIDQFDRCRYGSSDPPAELANTHRDHRVAADGSGVGDAPFQDVRHQQRGAS